MTFIKIFYGPYESNGIIRHKLQRLHGLLTELSKEDYDIEVIPSQHLNRITFEMCDREIFRCDIRNLMFNETYYSNDKTCQVIIAAIREHEKLFVGEHNKKTFIDVSEGMRMVMRRKRMTTKDILKDFDIDLIYEIGAPCNTSESEGLTSVAEKESSSSSKYSVDISESVMAKKYLEWNQYDLLDEQRPVCLCREDLDLKSSNSSYSSSDSDVLDNLDTYCFDSKCGTCPPINVSSSESNIDEDNFELTIIKDANLMDEDDKEISLYSIKEEYENEDEFENENENEDG